MDYEVQDFPAKRSSSKSRPDSGTLISTKLESTDFEERLGPNKVDVACPKIKNSDVCLQHVS